jgi:C1A family cysteine protease
MVLQKIPLNLELTSKKPIYLNENIFDKVTGKSSPQIRIIPPLNTNIDLSSLKPIQTHKPLTTLTSENKLTLKSIPTGFQSNFNWRDNHRSDQTSFVNEQFTPVGNQFTCGCCWAYSISNAVSDVFVINQNIKNPNCSVTYLLSCYPHCSNPNDQSTCTGPGPNYSYNCYGGAIASTVTWISQNGISTMNCEDCGRFVSPKTAGEIEQEHSDLDGILCIVGMRCKLCVVKHEKLRKLALKEL